MESQQTFEFSIWFRRCWVSFLAVIIMGASCFSFIPNAKAGMYTAGHYGGGRFGAGELSFPKEIAELGFYLDSQMGVTQASGSTDFDGVDDVLASANTSELSGDTSFEMVGWCRCDTGGEKALLAKSNGGSADQKSWMLRCVSGGLGRQLQFTVSTDGIDDGGYSATSETIYSSVGLGSTWRFFRAWHDATSNEIGVQVDDGTKATKNWSGGVFTSNQPIKLGARSINGGSYGFFDGALDSVAFVQNGRLSDEDATHLYNSGLGRNFSETQKSTRANLSHFYNLNGSSGTYIDHIGNLDFSPSGSPADGSGTPVAGVISDWDDQSANGYGFTPSAAERRPDYVRDFGNGNPVITPAIGFGRSNLQGDAASNSLMNDRSGGTLFIVYKPIFDSSGENTVFYYQAGNGLRRFNYSLVPNPSTPGDRRWLGVALDSDSGGYIQKTFGHYTDDKHTFEAVSVDYSQAKGSMWSDGDKLIDEVTISGITPGNTSNTNSTGVWIGANSTFNPGQFTVAAMVFYPRALTDDEINQLEAWAYSRYYSNSNTDYVVLVGDSNMAQTANPGGQRVHDYLDSNMLTKPWPSTYYIENMGLGGLKMSDLQSHLEANYHLSERYFINARNKFFLLQGGTNDKIIDGANTATIASRMRDAADFYKGHGFKTFVATPVPLESGATPDIEDTTIKALRDDFVTNGTASYGFTSVPNVYDSITLWSDYDPAEVGGSNQYIHVYPNADPNNGVKKQADTFYDSLTIYLGI